MFETWEGFNLAVIVLVLLLINSIRSRTYFQRNGVKSYTNYPLVGSLLETALLKKHPALIMQEAYEKFRGQKIFGFYAFTLPILVVRDPEVIKNITSRDFEHFAKHTTVIDLEHDRLIGKCLLFANHTTWKRLRSVSNTIYTTNKLVHMLEQMYQQGEFTVDYITEGLKNESSGLLEVELKKFSTKHTFNVSSRILFDMKSNSYKEHNDLYQSTMDTLNITPLKALDFVGFACFPRLMRLLNVSFIKPHTIRVTRNIILNLIKQREENEITEYYPIDSLMANRNNPQLDVSKNQPLTDDEVIGQISLFYAAGFETTSTSLTHLFWELAKNQDIQKRLQKEIDEIAAECDGYPTFDQLHSMEYMNMVISESLRKWPGMIVSDRMSVKQYTFPENNGVRFKIYPNQSVFIPIYYIHNDPEYYPNPEKFDPERFSEENKKNINPNTYIPFGIGMKKCLGYRFAVAKMKAITFQLLRKFDIINTSNIEKIEISPKSWNLLPAEGLRVSFKKRL